VVSVAVTQRCVSVQQAFVFVINYFQNPSVYREENPVKQTKITGHHENSSGIAGGLDSNLKREYEEVLLTVEDALSLVRINSERNCFKGKNTVCKQSKTKVIILL
jgi:hypothetical protein